MRAAAAAAATHATVTGEALPGSQNFRVLIPERKRERVRERGRGGAALDEGREEESARESQKEKGEK